MLFSSSVSSFVLPKTTLRMSGCKPHLLAVSNASHLAVRTFQFAGTREGPAASQGRKLVLRGWVVCPKTMDAEGGSGPGSQH